MAYRISAGKRARLRFGATLALIASMFVLSGCSAPDRISAKLDRGTVSFVSCEAFSANGILIETSDLARKVTDYKTVWTAAGSGKFGPDHPVKFGVAPAGFLTNLGPKSFKARHKLISFDIFRASRPGSLGTGRTAQFDGSKLVEGRWLRWDGSVADLPC